MSDNLVSDVWLARWEGGEHLERLVFAWLPLAYRAAREYYPRVCLAMDPDDLRQEIYLALIEAVDKFDEDRGNWIGCLFTAVRGRLAAEVRRHVKEREATPVSNDFLEGKLAGKLGREKPLRGPTTTECVTCRRSLEGQDSPCHGMCKTCCRQRERVKARTGHPGVCPYCVVVLNLPHTSIKGGSQEAVCMSCGYKTSDHLVTT